LIGQQFLGGGGVEPLSAAWLVGLLAGHAAKLAGVAVEAAVEQIEEMAGERVKALVAAIRGHFRNDPAATDALDRLEKAPEDQRRRGAVEERLEEALASDPEFAATVARLAEAIRNVQSQSISVRDSGAVAVGGSVNIRGGWHAAGRDIQLGSPGPAGRPDPGEKP
jgi:hypothetical protein